MSFKPFKTVIAAQFERMQKHPLFRVAIEPDAIWEKYLASFPAEANQIYRQRSEHDCSACKGFIRKLGGTVAVIDGAVVSLWDITINDPAYQGVCDVLAGLVREAAISDRFLHDERSVGIDKNFEQVIGKVPLTWEHLFVNLDRQFVAKKDTIPTKLGELRETKNVFLRGLTEITEDAITTVLELVAQGSLYRGEEHKGAVEMFGLLKRRFAALATDKDRDVFAWTEGGAGAIARIRNSVIGTLLVDLSTGVELEHAVKSFETKVAPASYKRPTALVTQSMVEKAKEAVEALGLTSALRRRHATINDLTINNIVFANRSSRRTLEPDAFSGLATASTAPKSLSKLEEIGIERFLSDVVPLVDSIEIMVENRHSPNFVSLIAPEDPTSGELFKWPNRYSWSYNGEMADSIKERVKAAGGSVTGDLCCRLAWDYTDDLDFHMQEPGGARGHIFFGQHRRSASPNGGILDLDANGADGMRPDPAENIVYANRSTMADGEYVLAVNNYHRRSSGVGFVVEIEFDGNVHRIEYDKVLKENDSINVAKIRYSRAAGFEIIESLPSSLASREVWGLKTQTFQPVNALMMSPNHWDEKAVGNKHYFFMVEGCRNDGSARGFYNEFLKEDLNQHRKVLEMVGGRVKVEQSDEQLSGLGFSSTSRNHVVCRVKGSFTRMLKVVF